MDAVFEFIGTANGFVWGTVLVYLLLGTHLYMTIRLGFIQRFIGKMIKLSVTPSKKEKGDISGFGALTTALAATIGGGNIVGVAAAIIAGGPGAVFWMWLTGVLGIATKYSECLLAIKYRTTNERGMMSGGPMYVLERGLNAKWLGILFAIFACLAGFGIGNMFQANVVADLMKDRLDFPEWGTGIVLVVITAAVTLGGVRSIARVAEFLVPIMAGVYLIGCLIVLAMNITAIPAAFSVIFTEAFNPQAVAGGFLGMLVAGVKRGLFSNEAGLGSAPIVASAAQTPNSVRQALVSASGTFWDTVVICLVSGVVIISSGVYKDASPASDSQLMAVDAFATIGGETGSWVLTFALATFAFSTILGWSYYGEKALEYLAGVKAIIFYRLAWLVFIYFGCVRPFNEVKDFSDLCNGLMALPNLIAVLLLSGVIVAETKKYLHNVEEEDPEVGAITDDAAAGPAA